MEFKAYRKKGVQMMVEWNPDMDMSGISISQPDLDNGSPMLGDMIAVNKDNPDDKWLVAAKFFQDNYEPA